MANSHWLMGYLQSGKAGTLPSAWLMWGRCPLAVCGSLLHDLLRSDWPSAHPGAVEIIPAFLLAARLACLLLLILCFLGGTEEGGAGNEP